jgi:hypothetical protein
MHEVISKVSFLFLFTTSSSRLPHFDHMTAKCRCDVMTGLRYLGLGVSAVKERRTELLRFGSRELKAIPIIVTPSGKSILRYRLTEDTM